MLLNLGGEEIGENLQEQILNLVLNSIRFLSSVFMPHRNPPRKSVLMQRCLAELGGRLKSVRIAE